MLCGTRFRESTFGCRTCDTRMLTQISRFTVKARARLVAGGTIRCIDRVHLPVVNCQFPAPAAWHALRLKLLPRIACSRHRLLPGCDTPADCLRRAPWSRVSHTRLLGRRRAKLDRRSRQNPRQIICRVAIVRIKGQRLLPLLDSLRRATDLGQRGAKIIARVYIVRLNF